MSTGEVQPATAHGGVTVSKGLEGVSVGTTSLSLVDGQAGRLIYRGYPIEALAGHVPFEATAHLLWRGELPGAAELEGVRAELAVGRNLPGQTLAVIRALAPGSAPLSALRTAVSSLAQDDRNARDFSTEESYRQAVRVTGAVAQIIPTYHRLRLGVEPLVPDPGQSMASAYLYSLSGRQPDPVLAEALDTYWTLVADHGFNASTFTARVVASTESDMISGVAAAIGALKGPLHGGAPGKVLDMLLEIGQPSRAEAWVRQAVTSGQRIMGFGHRVYKTEDPRARILRRLAERLSDYLGDRQIFELARTVEDAAWRVLAERKPNHKLAINVEFYTAVVLYLVGVPPDLFTATFAASRTVGWTAHILEQLADNRLIRPNVAYVGVRERATT